MALDVDRPDPPTLHEPLEPGDYDALVEPSEWTGDDPRREELANFLHEGAWMVAFDEWSEHTLLTDEEFEIVLDLGLIDEFDFYWNPAAEDVGYRAPSVPDDRPAPSHETLEVGDIEAIEDELDALGRTVCVVLENDYIHRDPREFGFFHDR